MMEKNNEGPKPLSEDQLEAVNGGTGEDTKVKVSCNLCNWNSGWVSSDKIAALTAAHTAATGHTDFYRNDYSGTVASNVGMNFF